MEKKNQVEVLAYNHLSPTSIMRAFLRKVRYLAKKEKYLIEGIDNDDDIGYDNDQRFVFKKDIDLAYDNDSLIKVAANLGERLQVQSRLIGNVSRSLAKEFHRECGWFVEVSQSSIFHHLYKDDEKSNHFKCGFLHIFGLGNDPNESMWGSHIQSAIRALSLGGNSVNTFFFKGKVIWDQLSLIQDKNLANDEVYYSFRQYLWRCNQKHQLFCKNVGQETLSAAALDIIHEYQSEILRLRGELILQASKASSGEVKPEESGGINDSFTEITTSGFENAVHLGALTEGMDEMIPKEETIEDHPTYPSRVVLTGLIRMQLGYSVAKMKKRLSKDDGFIKFIESFVQDFYLNNAAAIKVIDSILGEDPNYNWKDAYSETIQTESIGDELTFEDMAQLRRAFADWLIKYKEDAEK